MQLSEAIRLGAMLKPQAFGDYYDGQGSCALMAAYEAINQTPDDVGPDPFGSIPGWANRRCQCPACGLIEREDDDGFALGHMIAHLNDDHRWTREQIADWVETIEQQHDAKLIETPVMASVAAQDCGIKQEGPLDQSGPSKTR